MARIEVDVHDVRALQLGKNAERFARHERVVAELLQRQAAAFAQRLAAGGADLAAFRAFVAQCTQQLPAIASVGALNTLNKNAQAAMLELNDKVREHKQTLLRLVSDIETHVAFAQRQFIEVMALLRLQIELSLRSRFAVVQDGRGRQGRAHAAVPPGRSRQLRAQSRRARGHRA